MSQLLEFRPQEASTLQVEDPSPVNEWVDPSDFPAWSFVEFLVGNDLKVAGIYHLQTTSAIVPYWYEDPTRQHYGLPLLKFYRPVNIGDYASILQQGRNLEVFVHISKKIQDLPDPLYCVQVIRYFQTHPQSGNFTDCVNAAMANVDQKISSGRLAFDRAMRLIIRGPL